MSRVYLHCFQQVVPLVDGTADIANTLHLLPIKLVLHEERKTLLR